MRPTPTAAPSRSIPGPERGISAPNMISRQSNNFGSNTASIKLDAGACDYHNVVNNIVRGLAINDGGSGNHKTLNGNN